MKAAKRNRTGRRVGRGRGVPIAVARAVARKYNLGQIVIWTYDRQKRQRILCWGSSDGPALVAAEFARHVAKAFVWPKESCDFELAFVRRLKDRIKEQQTALAQIVEGEPNAIELARTAGKFPDESDNENLGEWIFFPKGKLSREQRRVVPGVLSSNQRSAKDVGELAYWTWQRLITEDCGNVGAEIETAIKHALARFGGKR